MAKRISGVRSALRTVASVLSAATAAASTASAEAPVLRAEQPIGGEYIVVFEEGSDVAAMMQRMQEWSGAQPMMQYETVLPGGLFKMTASEAQLGAKMPGVAYIEENGVVLPTDTNVQNPATYGIDRIDQAALPLDRSYRTRLDGTGVTIYVADSGVARIQQGFSGRVTVLRDFLTDGQNGNDCNGHGTHVAGTAGGNGVGVAQKATVKALRVFPCQGGSSNGIIVGAIDAATRDHLALNNRAVLNMSLGGGISPATDQAVARATQSGITVVVAAGNSNRDACQGSPARAPSAITVAASDANDTRARFSNFGSCVDIFAPGVQIQSLNFQVPNGNRLLSGTSMASPHVAGAAALVLQANPTFTPAQVAQELQRLATRGVIRDAQASPNALLRVPN